jgi:4-amino-4-deoxy-L-arabinose transferase-like glycosyltransferase/tetratricopeptide (TPR) repeat protein
VTSIRVGREGGVLLAFLSLLAASALWALALDASVADEHPHILSGWLFWESGRFSGGLDNPPLGQLLLAAPLRLFHLAYHFPSDRGLWLARLPVVVLLLGLGLLLWRWGRSLGGFPVALAAAVALCLEPNLIAHGHLATLDVPLLFFWWASLWMWRRLLLEAPEGRGVAWRVAPGFAVAFSLALGTKFTGILLVPACALVGVAVCRRPRTWLAMGGVLLGALLFFGLFAHFLYAFESTRFGLPEHLVQALQGKLAHRQEGHFAYLAGRRSLSGFPEYSLVAVLLKTPIPLLVLSACGCVLAWRRLRAVDRALLLVPGGVLLVVASLGGVHIGIRHVLPLYPALVLLGALGMVECWRRGRVLRFVLGGILVFWVASLARVAPQFLAYFNEIARGPAGGHRFLLDSNLAWGQDDARLQRFLKSAAARGESWQVNPPGRLARTGRLAVDVNTMHQLLRADDRPYAWLRSLPPAAHAGFSWPLYDLDLEDFARQAAAHPDDREAQLARAEVLAAARESAMAEALLERQAQGEARLPVARRAVWLFLEEGDLDAAASWLERGRTQAPDDPEMQRLQQRWQWEQMQATHPSAVSALGLGLWWLEQGEKERALHWLDVASKDGVDSAQSARALGSGLLQLGEFARAAQILASLPHAPERDMARGLAQAEAHFHAAESTGEDLPRAAPGFWLEFATTLFRTRRYDDAAGVLMQVLRQEPQNAAALSLLGEIAVRSKLRIFPQRLTPRAAPGVERSESP